jgi:S1-C subfamily serine protease
MTKFKFLGLMCYTLLLLIFGWSTSFADNSSVIQTNELALVEARETLKYESILQRAKEAIVMLTTSPNADPETDLKSNGLCAGVVVSDSGHILTNFHCVYRQNFIKLIYYSDYDYELHDVNVIGLDPLADLALLQVTSDVKPKSYIKFADDIENIVPGTEVFAFGHPMGMAWTLTKGIISSNERYMRHPYIKSLQTDAAINKGNSGGPLLNMKGEIVGINSMIISKITENAGVGIAVRGDVVKKSLESMLDNGRVDRPAVGIMIMGLINPKTRDKIIKDYPNVKPAHVPNTLGLWVRPGEVPEELKANDTVIGVGGVMINDGLGFSEQLGKYNIGDKVTLTIIRKRVFRTVEVTLKVLPVNAADIYPLKKPSVLPLPKP